jgi:hypothetical protein
MACGPTDGVAVQGGGLPLLDGDHAKRPDIRPFIARRENEPVP